MSHLMRWLLILVFAAFFGGEANASNAPVLIRGPYLQSSTESGIVVKWRTDLAVDTRLAFGPSADNLTAVVFDPGLIYDHEVFIDGLAPETRYFYSIGTSAEILAGADPDHFFDTAQAENNPAITRIWVLGDSGTANANSAAVRDGYLAATAGVPSDLWLMLGDNAYVSGTDEEYQAAVFDTYPTILRNTPLWSTLGNHDALSADSPTQTGPYYEVFTFPIAGQSGGVASGTEAYYSFDFGNIHFICLDTSDTSMLLVDPMAQWLVNDLQAISTDWIVAFFHHPPYSKGSHDSDAEAKLIAVREIVIPVLEQHGVDLVLAGHSHHYERSFFLDSHYGLSETFDPLLMAVDAGDGRILGDGAYKKDSGSHRGAVYVVNGTGGNVAGADFGLNHPAIFTSHEVLGSMVLEVEGDQMDARFIDVSGVTQDWFTIIKNQSLFRDGFESGDLNGWGGVDR